MISVVVTIKPLPDRIPLFEAKLAKLVDRVREEPGCKSIRWGPQIEVPGTYIIVETYADQAALELHRQSSHMAELGPDLSRLCVANGTTVTSFHEV